MDLGVSKIGCPAPKTGTIQAEPHWAANDFRYLVGEHHDLGLEDLLPIAQASSFWAALCNSLAVTPNVQSVSRWKRS